MKIINKKLLFLVISWVFLFYQSSSAQTDSLSLNGLWSFQPSGSAKTSLAVPGFYVWKVSPKSTLNFPTAADKPWKVIEGIPEATYETTFQIPETMNGKRIFLRFESVNFLAKIYINGSLVISHIGGYLPFEIDITSIVEIPSSNTLKVEIKYWDPSFVDANDCPLWPVGFYDNFWGLGITGGVTILARNPVYIENAYIQTSVSQHKIDAVVSLTNADLTDHTVILESRVEHNGSSVFSWSDRTVLVPAGDTVEVSLSQPWADAHLWRPDDPYLYQFISRVKENGSVTDTRKEQFGFREFRIEGNHFLLNGIQTNLHGDNITIYSEKQYWYYLVPTPQAWSAILDSMKALNFNTIRLHQSPPPQWMFDLCDEKGMMVISESAIMWRDEINPLRSPVYAQNSITWLKEWIRQYRNHPSIVIWSAENEMYVWGLHQCSREQLISFANTIEQNDPSRPIFFEGDTNLDGYADIMSYHYIYGYPKGWPTGSIYTSLSGYVSATIPTSQGEFEWWSSAVSAALHVRRQCVMTRASRIVGFSDIRPYRLDWAWHPNPSYTDIYDPTWTPSKEEKEFLRDTNNPIAVFDKSYYETKILDWNPAYNENDLISRNFVIFNDEWENTEIDIQVNTRIGGVLTGTKRISVDVPLGNHIEQTITFRAPLVTYNRDVEVELCSYKNNIKRFSETYTYLIKNNGLAQPKKVEQITRTRQDDGLTITWAAVTKDVEDLPETIDHYLLYRSMDDFTNPAEIDSFEVKNQTTFKDTETGHINDPNLNVYYTIYAIDNMGFYSAPSDTIVDFDYTIQTGGETNFSHIAVPIDDPNLKDARALLSKIPACKSIVRWDGAHQGYQQYVPEVSSTNFTIKPGDACWVQTSSDTVADFWGSIAMPAYSLSKIEDGSSFHAIMLPLDLQDLTTASELLADMEGCNSVAKWDNATQGFVQYDPGVPGSNFSVWPGHPYLVSVTKDIVWPVREPVEKSIPEPLITMESDFSRAPHLVWGEIGRDVERVPKNFTAWIEERPEPKLTSNSPGCFLSDDLWKVQCASLPGGWRAGETLVVELTDQQGTVFQTKTILTWNPSDNAEKVTGQTTSLPKSISLQNYPNPFNGETAIRIDLNHACHVELDILNARGQKICWLLDQDMDAGSFTVHWNAEDSRNLPVSAGLYLIRLKAGSQIEVRKILLMN